MITSNSLAIPLSFRTLQTIFSKAAKKSPNNCLGNMSVAAEGNHSTKANLFQRVWQKIRTTSFWKIFWLGGPALLFLFSLELLSAACAHLSKDLIENVLHATSNPFIGLFIGLLLTAIIQSSSTTTSMMVAVVSSGAISLETAVPIVIGANIGTTITATVVAFNHIFRRKEFQRALSAATLNGFFNILTASIVLPLEYYTRFLSQLCTQITSWLLPEKNLSIRQEDNFTLHHLAKYIAAQWPEYDLLLVLLAMGMLFCAIYWLVVVLKSLFMYNVGKKMEQVLFGTQYKSLFWGVFSTTLLQSSSVTTSFTVPLVANKKASLRQVFPFIMGANVGTTFTALIASLNNLDASVGIAIAHLLFNLIGVSIFFFVPGMREIPLAFAQLLGKTAMRYRLAGFLYLLFTFFALPFLLIYFSEK